MATYSCCGDNMGPIRQAPCFLLIYKEGISLLFIFLSDSDCYFCGNGHSDPNNDYM